MVNSKMKKTYINPTIVTVQLRGRDAILTSVSGFATLDDTSFGGTTSGGGNNITDADVKGISDVNVWDNEW